MDILTRAGSATESRTSSPWSTYPLKTFQEVAEDEPFKMPTTAQLLEMRAYERATVRKKEIPSVADKQTLASKMAATGFPPSLKRDLEEIDALIVKEMEQRKVVTILPVEHFHKNKENMAEFVYKKREIFLAQMALDTKKAEIRKLEDKIFQREEALRKSENMLTEDSLEFDAFLKQNDEKVQEAIRKAEQQARLKADKVIEAARLQNFTGGLKRDVAKYRDQLDDCRKYKDFLLELTPKEWLEANYSSAPQHDEAEKMYFNKPSQLLGVFTKIEEKNLMLMQECQDSEKALEDFRNQLAETKHANNAKIATLRVQFEEWTKALAAEEELQLNLENKLKLNMIERKSEFTHEEISEKVTELYARCGFDPDPSLGVIQMLISTEGKIEENVVQLEGVPHDYIEQTEKSREKERRLRIRAQRLEKARVEQERRAIKSLERSQAPVHKRAGKPIMFRSYLVKETKQEVVETKSDDDNEMVEFLGRSY